MIDAVLSNLCDAPTSDFVYSSLSFFARRRGGELPGSWFVNAVKPFGIAEQAMRQVLFRMVRDGSLHTRQSGRVKWYRASPSTQAVLDAGVARVREREPNWDGQWTLVHFRIGENERAVRDRIRDVLMVEGFGLLGPGAYLHPRDRTTRLIEAATQLGVLDRINVIRGPRVGGASDLRLVRDLWDTPAIANRYRTFIRRFAPFTRKRPAWKSERDAFGLRFAFMFEFFRITWDDPGLPATLLPDEWPGEEAREVADTLMTSLLPPAIAYGDELLRRCCALRDERRS